MSKNLISLTPGIYYITATNQAGYVVPKQSGAPLQFDDPSAKAAWKFTGDGKFICMDNPFYAFCNSLDRDSQVLGGPSNNPSPSMTWSVSVSDNGNGTFKGTVMTSNNKKLYWAGLNNTVVLKGDAWEFIFTPA